MVRRMSSSPRGRLLPSPSAASDPPTLTLLSAIDAHAPTAAAAAAASSSHRSDKLADAVKPGDREAAEGGSSSRSRSNSKGVEGVAEGGSDGRAETDARRKTGAGDRRGRGDQGGSSVDGDSRRALAFSQNSVANPSVVMGVVEAAPPPRLVPGSSSRVGATDKSIGDGCTGSCDGGGDDIGGEGLSGRIKGGDFFLSCGGGEEESRPSGTDRLNDDGRGFPTDHLGRGRRVSGDAEGVVACEAGAEGGHGARLKSGGGGGSEISPNRVLHQQVEALLARVEFLERRQALEFGGRGGGVRRESSDSGVGGGGRGGTPPAQLLLTPPPRVSRGGGGRRGGGEGQAVGVSTTPFTGLDVLFRTPKVSCCW